ncbi:MAG: TetR/AcrR family transcriptional regulator, partial [Pseudomonas sp.]
MTVPLRLTDRKREAIVAAAIAEFRDNGFEVTSMDKIAATAGVSKRTVYNHFPSKEELFAEILHQLWASSVAQLDVSYASDRPLREQLRGLLQAKMTMMSDANFLDLARVAIAATI